MAGTINYIAPVDNASGKIFGKKEKFVAVTRNWGKRRKGCSVTGKRDLKNKPYSPDELARYSKFTAVCEATRARLADTEMMNQDAQAYRAQSDKYNSLWHYVFKQVWDAYEG